MSPKRPFAAKRLADLVRPALEPLLAKRGLSQASLVLDWEAIVGARFGAMCEPAKLQWPPRGPKADPAKAGPATLWLRVLPGRALDVQYSAPALVERVNAHFGWRCIAAVKIAPEPKRARRSAPPLPQTDADARRRAMAVTRDVEDLALRDALTRLGEGALRSRPR